MCGVVAGVERSADELVRIAAGKTSHRGLRSRIEDLPGGCSIGHARLPVVGIGPENDQPVREGRWWVAFVGEILDFRKYTSDGCDVGLVARTWASEGAEGFRKFDGFWSVVAWDGERLYATVDYLSQKPLYVREDVGLVSSEPDSAAASAPTTVDEVYISAVFKWGYCPETWRTPYREVRRMRPGESMWIDESGRSEWSVTDPLRGVSSASPEVDLRAAVEEAVRLRVQSSDVPVACLLSGGLDSSVVRILAARWGDVRSYHVDTGGGEVGRCMEVDPRAVVVRRTREPSMRTQVEYMQEPIDLGSLVPQIKLSEAVEEIVCLTGDGADELLGGYGRAERYDSQASDVYHELVGWHLPRLDRVMMRNRVEVRSPFLSRTVAGISLGLPRVLRTGKVILKASLGGIVPRSVLEAPKVPLRTKEVELRREDRSRELVEEFLRRYRGIGTCQRS